MNAFDDIDFRKLVEQEPGFREYLSDVLVESIVSDRESTSAMKAIYSFYNIGVTVSQVSLWLKSIRADKKEDDEY